MKYQKQQNGIYKAQNGKYEITISRYENKWFADIELDGEYETTFTDCKTKKEAINCVNSYFGW